MKIMVKYCGYCRVNGRYNTITIDTERNEYSNNMHSNYDVFVEAHMSKDVNALRDECVRKGWKEV